MTIHRKVPFQVFEALVLVAVLIGCASPAVSPTAEVSPPPQPSATAEPTSSPTPTPVPLMPTATLVPRTRPDPVLFPKRIVGYYTSWSIYARRYRVEHIPAHQLTHINYAFANVSPGGTCVLGDPDAEATNFPKLLKLKQQYPHLRILISVGGWSWSGRFSDAAATSSARRHLASSCVSLFLIQNGDVFDGIDIDWEYPVGGGLETNETRPEDRENYTLLMQEFREQLDDLAAETGREYLLTIAGPAGPDLYANFELGELSQTLDWINIMAYDFHGGWDETTNFASSLYSPSGDPTPELSVDAAVQGYLAAGVPADKIVVGVPFYGRGWAGVPNVNNGLFQSTSGLPFGTWEPGVYDYKDLASNYVYKRGFVRYWNEEAMVPWLYNATTGVFITYEDPQSIGLKADYVNAQDLGGMMFWDLSGDDTTLLSAMQWRLAYGR